MNKTYRCLTCGFALVVDSEDKRPLAEINHENHLQELKGVENKEECPSCHGYLKQYGGRKNGKIQMPDITTPGLLADESDPEVKKQKEDLDADFNELSFHRGNGKLTALKKKYGNKRLYGFSVDDLIALHDRAKAKESV